MSSSGRQSADMMMIFYLSISSLSTGWCDVHILTPEPAVDNSVPQCTVRDLSSWSTDSEQIRGAATETL